MPKRRRQSGGVNIEGEGHINVGGDIVGRDKHVNYHLDEFPQPRMGCISRGVYALFTFLIAGAIGGVMGGFIGAAIASAVGGRRADAGGGAIAGALILGLLFAIGFSTMALGGTKTRK